MLHGTVNLEPVKSTHKVEVVPVRLEKHPNADRLSVVRIYGYPVCTATADWDDRPVIDSDGTRLGAYVPPDSLVPVSRPEFAFLASKAKTDGFARIKAQKLRGVMSFGLLVAAPPGARLGDNVASHLGVEHYEPPVAGESGKLNLILPGDVADAPDIRAEKYDVDAFRRFHTLFTPGEPVVVSEKLDGANARYVYAEGRMHCGSRQEWKKEFADYSHVTVEDLIAKGVAQDQAQEIAERCWARTGKRNMWWEVLDRTPSLARFCQDNPGVVVYGEVFGNVNCIKYGLPDGNRFAAFDLLRDGSWLNPTEALAVAQDAQLPWVPQVGMGGLTSHVEPLAYDFDLVCSLAEGKTLVPGAAPGVIREGVVVRPLYERQDDHVGRVCFKVVSGTYLERYR